MCLVEPERVTDTRDLRPDVYLDYHGSEAPLGDTDSQWPFVRANLDGFWGYWSSTTDTNAGINMAVELTRKVTERQPGTCALQTRTCRRTSTGRRRPARSGSWWKPLAAPARQSARSHPNPLACSDPQLAASSTELKKPARRLVATVTRFISRGCVG